LEPGFAPLSRIENRTDLRKMAFLDVKCFDLKVKMNEVFPEALICLNQVSLALAHA
jgi:hypothetical protein